MYESYWHLNKRPFDDVAKPEFYYPSRTHQATLLKLRYLIDQKKGIGIVAGDHGLGKTYLSHVLEREFKDTGVGPFVRLVMPQLTPKEMLSYLAFRLGVDVTPSMADDVVLRSLESKLAKYRKDHLHPVLLIDDAHVLEISHLNMLRLLLNLRESGVGDFSVILSGRSDLLARIKRIAPLEQRIAVRTALEPFDADDTHCYIQHRLQNAGCVTELFDRKSAQTIWELSQGIPRRINQICDLALLVGYVDELKDITPIEVEAAAEELISVRAA